MKQVTFSLDFFVEVCVVQVFLRYIKFTWMFQNTFCDFVSVGKLNMTAMVGLILKWSSTKIDFLSIGNIK